MLSFGISQTAGPRRRAASWASSFRQKRPADITPRLWQAQREGSESQLHDLREQVDAYERLQWGKDKQLLEAFEDLPKTLIQDARRPRLAARAQDSASATIRSNGIRERQLREDTQGGGSASATNIP